MVSKKVRNTAIGIGLTAGVLGLAVLAARRTNAGEFLTEGFRGFGETVGALLTQPFVGIVEGVNQGGQDLFSAGSQAGENVGNVFGGLSEFFNNLFPQAQGTTLEVSQAVQQQAQGATQRLQQLVESGRGAFRVTEEGEGQFGGFQTAQAQQDALARAIEESRRNFPSFFNLG